LDIFKKCEDYLRADQVKDMGVYPYFLPMSGNDGPTVTMDGREIIMAGSNNYLGLSKDPRVIEAAVKATEKYGTTCSGSRFLNGTLLLHEELEERLAAFVDKEAALTFSTGFTTNLGAIATLMGRRDYIISDKANHASIVAGQTAAMGATVKRYQHNDPEDLERILKSLPEDAGILIVSDGVFSMEGDIVRFPEIYEIGKRYKARFYIDDAHGIGVIGKSGRGTGEHFDMQDKIDLQMSTFSKSFGSLGGFIAGDRMVINFIKHTSRPLIFSASPTPGATAAVLASLLIIQQEPELVHRLQWIGNKMAAEFKAMGFETGHTETPIIPLLVGEDLTTFKFWRMLFDAGIYANAVISPAVPQGRALIRTSFMSTHTDAQLDFILSKFKEIGKKFGII
jgi:8-amino-7-oxononanoate synthase